MKSSARVSSFVGLLALILMAQLWLSACRQPITSDSQRQICAPIPRYDQSMRIEQELREDLPLRTIGNVLGFDSLQSTTRGIRLPQPSREMLERCADHAATERLQVICSPTNPDSFDAIDLRRLRTLPNLRVIELIGVNITQAHLRELASLEQLEQIVLAPRSASSITPAALDELSGLASLERLQLEALTLSTQHLESIATLSSLTSLRLFLCANITSTGLVSLSTLSALTDFRMHGAHFVNGWSSAIASLAHLELLDLTGCSGLQAPWIADFANLTNLQVLLLNECGAIDAWLIEIAKISTIVELGIERSDFSDARISELIALDQLEVLNLQCCTIGDFALQHIASIPKLRALWIGDNPITDAGLRQLASTDVRWLKLGAMTFSDLEAAAVREIESLETLLVPNQCDITSLGLGSLSFMPNLSRLQLMDSALSDDDFVALRRMDRLRSLTIGASDFISGSFVNYLASSNSCIEELILIDCPGLRDSDMEFLGNLEGLKRLSLDVRGNPSVSDVTLTRLFDRTIVEELHLMGWGGFSRSLARSIVRSETLAILALESSSIAPNDLEYLQNETSLEVVDDTPAWVVAGWKQ